MRNPTYEQALKAQGVEWEYVDEVKIKDIDIQKGLRNQARLDAPIDEELVEQYAIAKQRGDQFPPLVLWRPSSRARYIALDGNQRIQATIKAGQKGHDAYVLKTTDPVVIDRVSWTFNNAVNGKRLSREEAIQHAMTFVRKYGYAPKESAREWSLPFSTLQMYLRNEDLRETLENANVNTRGLDGCRLRDLGPLEALGEDVLARGAKIAIDNGLTSPDIQEMVQEVKNAKRNEDKLKVLEDFAKSEKVVARRAETRGGKVDPKVLPRARMMKSVRALKRLFEDYPRLEALRPAKVDFAAAKEDVADVVARLTEIFGLGVVPEVKEKVG